MRSTARRPRRTPGNPVRRRITLSVVGIFVLSLGLLALCASQMLSENLERRLELLWAALAATCLLGSATWWAVSHQLARLDGQPPEEELRIAAAAFDTFESIVVLDASLRVLRVNQAYTRATGFTQAEIQGKTTEFARSARHSAAFYEAQKAALRESGSWTGEVWLQCKDGREERVRLVVSAIRNIAGEVTHFVSHGVDVTQTYLLEQERLRHEAEHRRTLVREVHHRIKNNLQGITGVLRQQAHKHPETLAVMNQAIHQVQAISFIHGLQGREANAAVHLGELVAAIAAEIQGVWQTPISLTCPPGADCWCLADNESVPIALVLNELVSNAVKHGAQPGKYVKLVIVENDPPDHLCVLVANPGRLSPGPEAGKPEHTGLQLVSALLPANGARMTLAQQGGDVVAMLELRPPVIYRDPKEPT